MKKLRKPYWFYDDVYRLNYYFMPGFTKEEIEMAIKKNSSLDYECSELDGYGGKCIQVMGNIYLWVDCKSNVATLAHECLHAAHLILRQKGVDVTTNDEALAYYLEFIMRKCLRFE